VVTNPKDIYSVTATRFSLPLCADAEGIEFVILHIYLSLTQGRAKKEG